MRQVLLLLVLAAAGYSFCSVKGQSVANPQSGPAEYSARLANCARVNPVLWAPNNRLKIVITAVGTDNLQGIRLTTDGKVFWFLETEWDAKGQDGPHLSTAELLQLDDLLAKLPNDPRSPSADRGLVIQCSSDGKVITHVYDRADMPDTAWDVLRLTKCPLSRWVFQFRQKQDIKESSYGDEGAAFGLTPDQSAMIYGGQMGPLRVIDVGTQKTVAEIPDQLDPISNILFSPDGSIAVVTGGRPDTLCLDTKTWKVVAHLPADGSPYGGGGYPLRYPHFTADGRYLMLRSDVAPMKVFDIRTWQRVAGLPEIPDGAVLYAPNPFGGPAVVETKNHLVVLWDSMRKQEIAKISEDGGCGSVAYSPDGSLVAMRTVDAEKKLQIGIWNAKTGTLVKFLQPYEWGGVDEVGDIAWTQKGDYLFVVTRPGGFFTAHKINLFNVHTGKHVADFVGCVLGIRGMGQLQKQGDLVVGCLDGNIRLWDLTGALAQVEAFEATTRY